MLTEKDKWIEKVMRSLDGAQPAAPSPFLYERIVHRLQDQKAYQAPARLVWLAAASFVILLLLNIQVMHARSGKAEQQETQQLADRYHLLNTNTVTY